MSVKQNIAPYLGRYDLKLTGTPIQQITEQKIFFLELKETHLIFQMAFHANERDDEDSVIWKEQYHSVRNAVRREWVSNVSLFWHVGNQQWRVQVDINGCNNDLWIHFTEHREAKELYERVEQWYLDYKAS